MTELNMELVEQLREKARAESRASKMLADAKTARQSDRDDYPELANVGYDYTKPEQTASWRAASELLRLQELVRVLGEALGEIKVGSRLGIEMFEQRVRGSRGRLTWYAVNVLQDNLAACEGTADTALNQLNGGAK